MKDEFGKRLAEWYRRAARDLPWRRTRDPYAIWVSEIMLQQTRVQAVIPYYERFLARFPDVASLASAPEQDLLAMWAGLGYYSRARNLQKAARQIVERGSFPRDYDDIRALAGVGDYTAAAVASLAFGRAHAVVDGNVLRVLARVTADPGDIKNGKTRKRLQDVADELLERRDPGRYNQALMELGATVCVPRDPKCLLCPVAGLCAAREAGRQGEFPISGSRAERKREERTLLVIERNGKILLRQRGADERLMPGFWELPEARDSQAAEWIGTFRHSITNHDYTFRVAAGRAAPRTPKGHAWWARGDLANIPLSTTAKKALRLCAPARAQGDTPEA